jgi:hypothetical protein
MSMSTNVEILVPTDSASKVKAALGSLPERWFLTKPSRRKAPHLLVAPLADLDVPQRRLDLEKLYGLVVGHGASVVFIEVKSEFPRTRAGLQALTHWARLLESEPYIATDPEAVRRVAQARQRGAEKDLIASASVEGDKLVVWSCEPKRYDLLVAEIPVLAKLTEKALKKFEVSASGSRIHWAEGDIDINLDTIREHTDPLFRKQHEALRRKEAARYGSAIREVREAKGLTQSGISGLSARQVRRLEEGETVPHASTLEKLAAAHGLSIERYLKDLAKRSRARPRSKAS